MSICTINKFPHFFAFLPKMQKKCGTAVSHRRQMKRKLLGVRRYAFYCTKSEFAHRGFPVGVCPPVAHGRSSPTGVSLSEFAIRGSRQKITDTGSVIFMFLLANDTATLNTLNDLILQEYIRNDKRNCDKDCCCSCDCGFILWQVA